MQCKICQKPSFPLSKAKVLNKYWVDYFKCDHCGFIFTEDPYWLPEAYSEAINRSDLGLVDRNIRLSYSLMPLILSYFNPDGKFVDYGGGYGLLVRIMRDRGLDFYRYDQYCENIFAKGFDITEPGPEKFELMTAIEVFEHLVDPVTEIQKMLEFSKNIFFATELLPEKGNTLPGQWSYYGLEHGQHISLYTRTTLKLLADRLGVHFVTDGKGMHLFTQEKKSQMLFKMASSSRIGKYMLPFIRRKSFLHKDYYQVTGHEL